MTTYTTALPQWGLIRLAGADAAPFIHNQLTQDFLLIKETQARLAAWCSPKGRVLVSFYGWRPSAEEVLLLCPADSIDYAIKRLSMFVLRSKVKVSNASAEFSICGTLTPTAALDNSAINSGALPLAASDGTYALQLPSVAHSAAGDLGHFSPVIAVKPASEAIEIAATAHLDLWNEVQVLSGIAIIGEALREAFVPQMINYESIGAVNFKKGCYPGQEIVARSQFRGQIKRRAYIVHAPAALTAGAAVLTASDAECGLVVMAAPAAQGGWHAIVSVQSEHSSEALHVGDQTLRLLPLPYALAQDI